jgi:hypothetical protein
MKQPRKKYPKIKRLTIVIEARESSDGSSVSMSINGKVLEKIFDDGVDNWTQLKGCVHQIIGEIGLTRHGRNVKITSEP